MKRVLRRLSVSTILALLNVGLVLVAIGLIAGVTVWLLWRLADQQATAAARQGALNAQQALIRVADVVATDAAVLADRPTLQRLVQQDDRASLAAFLVDFTQTSRLSGALVVRNNVPLSASTGINAAVYASLPSAHHAVLVIAPGGGTPLLVSRMHVAELPGVDVIVSREIDAATLRQISQQVGMDVALLPRAALAGPEAALIERKPRLPVATRLDGPSRYAALIEAEPAGETTLLLQVSSDTTAVDQSMLALIPVLVVTTVGVALIVGLISALLGRRLSQPLHRLSAAANRIGMGDLATPVRPAWSAEVGALAQTFEDMRQRLHQLTLDLRRQQAEANAIVTSIAEGIFVVDADRHIRFLNPQAAHALGTTPDAAAGRFCGDVLNPQGPQGRPCATACPIVAARTSGRAQAVEHLLLPNGESRTVVIVSTPLEDGQQVQVIRDETEQEAVRRARDAVLANISHEFRTPLSAQLASIELLIERLPELSTAQVAQLVQSLQRGTLRLVRLVDNLLESVRIESGQRTIRSEAIDLDSVIEDALEFILPLLRQRGQEVAINLPYPLPKLRGDGVRLTQVFVNLLANANKYAPSESTIRIGGEVDAAIITLWVQDTGTTLPHAAGDTLFERFVRAATNEPPQVGMGMGLWIVKSIVERHGGQISAASTEQGVRFTVRLPIEQDTRDEDLDR